MASPSFLQASTNSAQMGAMDFLPLFFAALMAAFWAYEGWNNVGFVGEEIKQPERAIPRALVMGVGLVMGLYVLLNLTFFLVMPIAQIQGIPNNEVAGISIMRHLGGDSAAAVVAVLILVSTFNATNTTVLTAPRVCFAMARDGLFFKGIERLNAHTGTPVRALLLQCFWALVLVFSGSFDMLTDMLIFAAFIFYGMGAFGVFVLRKKGSGKKPPFSVPGYPVLPALFVLFSLALVAVSVWNNPAGSAAGLGLMAIGIPLYLKWR
jgi:APA family basic amino acid/polyamine antiporter